MKPRVALINELLGSRRTGGEQAAMHALGDRLRADFDVQELSYAGNGSDVLSSAFPRSLREMPYFRELFVTPSVGRSAAKRLRAVDLIHTSSTVMFASAEPPVPLILSIHSIRSQQAEKLKPILRYRPVINGWVRAMLRKREHASFMRAQFVVVLHEAMREYTENVLGIPHDRVIRIPNAVDTKMFVPGTEPTRHDVLFVGRATHAKGIDVIVDSARDMHGTVGVVTNVCPSQTKSALEHAGVRTSMTVSHDTMPDVYRSARIFILPSRAEEQPLTILEAMASGLPVVVSPEAASDLVTDGQEGIIVRERSATAYAAAVNRLLGDEQLRQHMGAAGRARAERSHSWAQVTRSYTDLYERALSERTAS